MNDRPERTQIMTLREVSKYLRIHEMTVYRHAKNGSLPGFRIGGGWRFRRVDIERMADGIIIS